MGLAGPYFEWVAALVHTDGEATMTQERTALVLGATGGIGGAMAATLLGRGWRVRALRRKAPDGASAASRIDWRLGDAMRREDVMSAARGVALIVHAVNPPGYRDWDKLVLPGRGCCCPARSIITVPMLGS